MSEGTFRIETLHVFIARDADGVEGVPSVLAAGGVMMPLVAADEVRLQLIMPLARALAKANDMEITHVRFNGREDLEKFT